MDEKYIAQLQVIMSIHPEIIKADGKRHQDRIHTTSWNRNLEPVKRVLKEMGFENVYVEPQQAVAGRTFPDCTHTRTRRHPDAWELALKLAKEKDARYCTCHRPGCRPSWRVLQRYKEQESTLHLPEICQAMLIAEYILRSETCKWNDAGEPGIG